MTERNGSYWGFSGIFGGGGAGFICGRVIARVSSWLRCASSVRTIRSGLHYLLFGVLYNHESFKQNRETSRIVVHVDGSVEIIPELEYQTLIRTKVPAPEARE